VFLLLIASASRASSEVSLEAGLQIRVGRTAGERIVEPDCQRFAFVNIASFS
jgi:hypothetical protein